MTTKIQLVHNTFVSEILSAKFSLGNYLETDNHLTEEEKYFIVENLYKAKVNKEVLKSLGLEPSLLIKIHSEMDEKDQRFSTLSSVVKVEKNEIFNMDCPLVMDGGEQTMKIRRSIEIKKIMDKEEKLIAKIGDEVVSHKRFKELNADDISLLKFYNESGKEVNNFLTKNLYPVKNDEEEYFMALENFNPEMTV